MREIDQVRLLRPGQMPKAVEWNAIVRQLQAHQPTRAGYDGAHGLAYHKEFTPYRQPILLYSSVDIPAYSVFPIKIRTGEDEFFEVCEFDKTKISEYVDGYWATNGQYEITKEIPFYGWLLDENHDDPVAVYSENVTVEVGDECGLSERAGFKADPDSQGIIITGTFSDGVYYVRKLGDWQFSEVFGKMLHRWDGIDYEHSVEISLDDDFTVQGSSTLMAYPAPTLVDNLVVGDEVSCRYVKSVGKWFFFRPVTGRLLTVSGDPLFYRIGGPARTDFTVFYSEILANEFIGECQLMAWPKKQEITGSTFSLPWVKYPTNLISPYEKPLWVGWVDNFNGYGDACYQYKDSNNTYHIVPTDYYGLVFYDETGATSGDSRWWMPELRQINGYGYWAQKFGGGFIYYTAKRNNSNDWKWGWTKGSVLGKWLDQNDTQPFTRTNDLPSGVWFEQAASFASSLGYAAKKPEWTSNSQFGIYTANSINDGPANTQFGCGRWIASDGRTLSGNQIMYFTHTSIGTKQFWLGRYTCQAFNKRFKNIEYLFDSVAREYYYYLGDRNAGMGCYRSSTAPSTSSSVTFSYVPGPKPLKGVLRYVHTNQDGSEEWEMALTTGKHAYYTCAEGATTLTNRLDQIGYYFGDITKSGETWVAAGDDGTIGTLVFEGETLSKESSNDFIFNHEITLTFDQYVQGSEHECVYICNPGVLS